MTRTTRSLVGNIVLTGILVLVGLGGLRFLGTRGDQLHAVDGWAVALVVVAALSVMLRWWPLAFFGVSTICVSIYLFLGYPNGPILLSLVIATYTVARWERRLPIAVGAAVVAVLLMVARVFTNPAALEGFWGVLPSAAWIVVPFSVGMIRRVVVESADRQRAESERRALDDERVRLASEVHDIVGHGLAAIQMQADIALHVQDRKPEQAAIALNAISRTSAQALAELRATLAAIAPDGAAAAEESLVPTPGLVRVPELCARMRESGIHIDLVIIGAQRRMAPAVDVAAYRVIQESLTNVAKHATERHASVEVRYEPDSVHVEVVNPTASAGSMTEGQMTEGFGITGMRRRIDDVGGRITVSSDDGEFRVAAVLPG